jgi:tripartite-type tricarboxylate transporter receptor subunit TctC
MIGRHAALLRNGTTARRRKLVRTAAAAAVTVTKVPTTSAIVAVAAFCVAASALEVWRIRSSSPLATITESVVKAAPDGYTLLMVAPTAAINATLYEKLNFNFLRDMAPVAGVVRVPNVLEVHPSVPVKTVPELIELARAKPGSLTFASAGVGTASHLAGEMFKVKAGVDLVHVAYRGDGPAMTDLIGGQVQVGFATMTASIGHIRNGKLRPLAVTTATRSDVLPELPTVGDFIPGYEASSWFGVAAPKDTPAEVIDTLNREINAGFADPRIRARLADMSGMPLGGSPAEYGKLMAEETAKWGAVIRSANIKPE